MAISYKELLSAVAKRAGVEEKVAEEQIAALVKSTHAEAESEMGCQIEGFGTFRFVNNVLEFEPEEAFALEANFKYAGMKPILIMEGYQKKAKTDAADSAKKEEEKSEAKQKETEVKKTEKTEKPASASGDALDKLKKLADSGKKDKPVTPKPEVDKKSEPPVKKEAKPKEAQKPEPKQEKTPPAKKEPVKAQPVKPAEKADKKAEKPQKPKVVATRNRKEDNSLVLIAASVMVILLLVGLISWLVRSGTTVSPPPGPDYTESTDVPPTIADPTPETAERDRIEEPRTESERVETTDTRYGLYGSQAALPDYFTIVLYSLRSEDRAQNQKTQLLNDGYRVAIHNVVASDGVTNYRVAVGQFSSVAEAQRAVTGLPTQYRDQNFIVRIRS